MVFSSRKVLAANLGVYQPLGLATGSLPLARLGLKGAQIKGQSTWHFSRITDPATQSGRRISAQHPVDAELHFTQDLPRRKFNWGLDLYFGVVETLYRFNEIDVSRQGTVASVHGHCVGGAALLAVACDIRIGADDLRVTIPELAIIGATLPRNHVASRSLVLRRPPEEIWPVIMKVTATSGIPC